MTDNTFLNALIGAVITLVFSFTVVSPILGGAVAAWLHQGTREESIQIGALSGLLVFLPVAAFIPIILLLDIIGFAVFAGLVLIAFIGAFLIGCGALGGYLTYYVLGDSRIPGTRK